MAASKLSLQPIMPRWLSSLPADISVSAILSGVAAATVTAASFFLIYKSHLRPHKENLITLRQKQPKRNTCGKILFVSQIGTSEAFAKCLCDFLDAEGHLRDSVFLELVDARNYEPEGPPKESIVLLVASNSEYRKRAPNRASVFVRERYLPFEAEEFGWWLQENAKNFGGGVFAVNGGSFRVFGVGSEDGKNLMAKAGNYIRNLGHTAKFKDALNFEDWWQGVVAVLKGAVLGDTVDAEQSELLDDAGCCDPKRIYLLVENVDEGYRSTTYRPRMLTITEANFMKNGTVVLEDGGPVTAQWPVSDGVTSGSILPIFEGFCSVGQSLFFVGQLDYIGREWRQQAFNDTANIWCLKYDGDGSAWIWRLCRSMFFHHRFNIVIPYDGKLCIIAGDLSWVDIYDRRSEFWEKRQVPDSVQPASACVDLHSYFLSETLIVLYVFVDENQCLMSYDLNANIWSSIECNFPPVCHYPSCRKLIRLGCSDYLLIIDFVTIWYIYDLSKKKLVAIVHLNDLDEMGIVSDVFCCHYTSKESLIYVFINPVEMDLEEESFIGRNHRISIVPYARVKLQTNGYFSAKVESKGNLKVGPYMKHYVFAAVDQDIKGKTAVA